MNIVHSSRLLRPAAAAMGLLALVGAKSVSAQGQPPLQDSRTCMDLINGAGPPVFLDPALMTRLNGHRDSFNDEQTVTVSQGRGRLEMPPAPAHRAGWVSGSDDVAYRLDVQPNARESVLSNGPIRLEIGENGRVRRCEGFGERVQDAVSIGSRFLSGLLTASGVP